jgi:hypothetical protein
MANYFDSVQNLGSMLTDEQKEDLRLKGEQFYGSIDMDQYRPVPTEEAQPEKIFTSEQLERIQYGQLVVALNSGLLEDDLTAEELEILKKYR